MILMYKNLGTEVQTGDVVAHREETWTVSDPVGRPPHKSTSTSRVYVEEVGNEGWTREFYPSVFEMEWVIK